MPFAWCPEPLPKPRSVPPCARRLVRRVARGPKGRRRPDGRLGGAHTGLPRRRGGGRDSSGVLDRPGSGSNPGPGFGLRLPRLRRERSVGGKRGCRRFRRPPGRGCLRLDPRLHRGERRRADPHSEASPTLRPRGALQELPGTGSREDGGPRLRAMVPARSRRGLRSRLGPRRRLGQEVPRRPR